ncbi:N-acetyltransferase [Nocardioides baekrokdamisoli]|uniref:N-acetyltransferase n=1 Tax=Nocardioides baekrokdamisoli TaxID=1804624 RepID=A0A3G9IV65_9ACTN|nr:GNAT family N-acetyltransferase [Nocardioides baekrokdamisoli]BBH16153.1 N-acetyltransferase [Nocardioides baekrokdamisoli]
MTDTAIEVVDVPDLGRFEIHVDGTLAGFAQYRIPDAEHVDFIHTEIDDAYAGQGLAGRLATASLDQLRAEGRRAIPHCPFYAAFIKKHPEYEDITDWPAR